MSCYGYRIEIYYVLSTPCIANLRAERHSRVNGASCSDKLFLPGYHVMPMWLYSFQFQVAFAAKSSISVQQGFVLA